MKSAPRSKKKPAPPPRTFRVHSEALLEQFLFDNMTDLKKIKVRQLLKFHCVFVNDAIKSLYKLKLKKGDVVRVEFDRPRVPSGKLPKHPGIRYIDEYLIVVEKAAGLLSVATDKQRERTAYHQINEYLQAAYPYQRNRAYIVHRLDRETSGLLMFARTEDVRDALKDNWKSFIKTYTAIVEGVPKQASGTIQSHLIEDETTYVMRSGKESPESKLAITHYKVVKIGQGRAQLEVRLETGRKNQIRVHLAELGYPIVGDKKYGAKTNPIERMCLHATTFSLTHPTTGSKLELSSRPPLKMMKLVKAESASGKSRSDAVAAPAVTEVVAREEHRSSRPSASERRERSGGPRPGTGERRERKGPRTQARTGARKSKPKK